MTDPAETAIRSPAINSAEVSLKALMLKVAAKHKTSIAHLKGPQRTKLVADARKEFYRLAWGCGRYSSTQIAAAVNRDHTTVLYAVGRLAKSKRVET